MAQPLPGMQAVDQPPVPAVHPVPAHLVLSRGGDLEDGDVVEQVYRQGTPRGGWLPVRVEDGVEALRPRLAHAAAWRQGFTLRAGPGEPVDPEFGRLLTAIQAPARLVREPG